MKTSPKHEASAERELPELLPGGGGGGGDFDVPLDGVAFSRLD